MKARHTRWLVFVGIGLGLAACQAAGTAPPAPQQTQAAAERPSDQTAQVRATEFAELRATPVRSPAATQTSGDAGAPAATSDFRTSAPQPTPVPTRAADEYEGRVVELEWPARMRLGESGSVRLALVPSQGGYTLTTEFPDQTVVTQTVTIQRRGGYDLSAVARLDGVGFDIAPQAEHALGVPPGEAVAWRWTIAPRSSGRHTLTVSLRLRWTPQLEGAAPVSEAQVYSRSLSLQITSFLGLTQSQAMMFGLIGLLAGGGLSVLMLVQGRPAARSAQASRPNLELIIEPPPRFELSLDERGLLQILFRRYARVVIEGEFRSGYSGARTLLALPLRPDGRADAHTIVKIGERRSIEREHRNYETFVKETLPPITARIQEVAAAPRSLVAALRYTFIAEPGRKPISLREALLTEPDPELLTKLFDTFGPNWWLQRRPHTFRLAQEYDRLLPAHYMVRPGHELGGVLDGHRPPSDAKLDVGDSVSLKNFAAAELRADGQSFSLTGHAAPGQPPLRVRWLARRLPDHTPGRVVATRESLLREKVSGFDLFGLPDPIPRLPGWLNETVAGSQSTVHGDLNLENVLVGPGGFVWLIDFAQTRDGHPLSDFAHLYADVVAHVAAARIDSPASFLTLLGGPSPDPPHANFLTLLARIDALALRCLANPSQPREYQLARVLACLGALKYANLTSHQRHLLYLAAAHHAQSL